MSDADQQHPDERGADQGRLRWVVVAKDGKLGHLTGFASGVGHLEQIEQIDPEILADLDGSGPEHDAAFTHKNRDRHHTDSENT